MSFFFGFVTYQVYSFERTAYGMYQAALPRLPRY